MEYEELQQLTEKMLELLQAKNYREIKRLINDLQPVDCAALLEELSEKDILPIFRLLSKENAAETFVEMSYDSQELLLTTFTDAELKAVFDEMFLDDTVDIIEEMPANVVKRIIKQSDAETRAQINEILKYPRDSAGTIMTVEYVSLREHMTVKECFLFCIYSQRVLYQGCKGSGRNSHTLHADSKIRCESNGYILGR